MIICAAGDIHGALGRFYDDVLAFEAALGTRFDWVLHVGDFGIWPDPSKIDGASRRHGGAGDFPTWHTEKRGMPRPTLFVKGNHDDVAWLAARGGPEILPGLWHLRNGSTFRLAPSFLTVGGVGGCYGPSDYGRPSKRLQGYAKRHYARDEIETLAARGHVDVLLLHDAPLGVRFPTHDSVAVGLDELLAAVSPRVCFFGHHHARVDAEVAGVRCIGLNIVGRSGNLFAVELEEGGSGWSELGEWPK